ncbi:MULTISPECIES: hypothetical protein [Stenotrophomonas]|uniref:hypothetical protein n=1 Tax=Stenotrophomonas TaxID=40323 RepID=UPI000872E3B3|nr:MULTISPECIES: hypothetical protein [Stenotrophomonas]OEZ01272.1 hypothetical protein BIY45_07385 [Stenotrophomonas sp. BIIR7]
MSDGSGAPATSDLSDLIGTIWSQVVGQVNTLIDAHKAFGFFQFNENLNPTLADVLTGLAFIDFALTRFLESGKLEFDEQRNAINSKQCILKMKSLSLALDQGNKAEFENIMSELRSQSKF